MPGHLGKTLNAPGCWSKTGTVVSAWTDEVIKGLTLEQWLGISLKFSLGKVSPWVILFNEFNFFVLECMEPAAQCSCIFWVCSDYIFSAIVVMVTMNELMTNSVIFVYILKPEIEIHNIGCTHFFFFETPGFPAYSVWSNCPYILYRTAHNTHSRPTYPLLYSL